MSLTRRFASLVGLIAAFSCSDMATNVSPNGSWSVGGTWGGQIVITPDTHAPSWPDDQATIQAFAFKGDSLELTVTYGGGCREHAFLLLADAAWMESSPVQVGVKLSHDAKGDSCKALMSRVLRFDLSPLRSAYASSYHATSGQIRLNLSGTSAIPLYSW